MIRIPDDTPDGAFTVQPVSAHDARGIVIPIDSERVDSDHPEVMTVVQNQDGTFGYHVAGIGSAILSHIAVVRGKDYVVKTQGFVVETGTPIVDGGEMSFPDLPADDGTG